MAQIFDLKIFNIKLYCNYNYNYIVLHFTWRRITNYAAKNAAYIF